jgi:agmatine deiminase
MPAEWEPHERTWMAFPPPNATFGEEGSPGLEAARIAWTEVANTVAQYEPVTLVAGLDQGALATSLTGPGVSVIERALDDAWMRDTGPTFTTDGHSLGAVDWVFNGWGAQEWANWDHDALLAREIGLLSDADVTSSRLTNEGGGIHVDGAGTVLLTETVQLDPQRNPEWTRADVETEIHSRLGTRHAVWLPRGLTRDYGEFGTRGHVDIVATFVSPGVVAVHCQLDSAHPDYEVTRELISLLRASTDAEGRSLEVVEVPAPKVLEVDGEWTDFSYINHFVGNGFVVVGVFDDANDDAALDILARLYPGRRLERADGRTIFSHGGGVHCITQQQPRLAS